MKSQRHEVRSSFRPDLVPLWARIAAWSVLAVALPSVVWRLSMAIEALITEANPCMNSDVTPLGEKIYITAVLPTVQIGLALLTLGLIQRWGEVFWRWIPFLGGRRVPISFGVSAATAGALAIAAIFVSTQLIWDGRPANPIPAGCTAPGWDIERWYAPMLLWPPLLLAVAWHYLRRRRIEDREAA